MAKTSDIAELVSWHSDTPCAAPTVGVEWDDQVLTITDDLPHDAAIGLSEIDAIERYMSDILDVVLGSCAASATTEVKQPKERMR
jgi:hypothetical protein